MTPEAQRITIAEACGWKRDEICDNWKRTGDVAYCDGRSLHYRQIPDFLNDLNAMHEAVCHLDDKQRRWFCNHIVELTGTFEAINATAAQRAEAFLRTIGKWTE